MKRIIYCADGTWESSTSHFPTNVCRFYRALARTATQLPFYDEGVGADGNPILHWLGGAMGTGIWHEVKEGYAAIAHVYEAGDEVFLIGFSRGAYTARSLGGMIAVAGLPTEHFDDALVDDAFKAYRERDVRDEILSSFGKYKMFDTKIKMIGVWDTVGSLGIPSIVGGVDPIVYGFLDTALHPDVLNACQALAVDERRCEFPPTLWTSSPVPGQTIAQVWFAGAHNDVGGGYPETGLADITLSWMMNKGKTLGLEFDPPAWTTYGAIDPKHALDTIHESWKLWWGFPRRRVIAPGSQLSDSVVLRSAHDQTYHPSNLTMVGNVPSGYSIIIVVGKPASE